MAKGLVWRHACETENGPRVGDCIQSFSWPPRRIHALHQQAPGGHSTDRRKEAYAMGNLDALCPGLCPNDGFSIAIRMTRFQSCGCIFVFSQADTSETWVLRTQGHSRARPSCAFRGALALKVT